MTSLIESDNQPEVTRTVKKRRCRTEKKNVAIGNEQLTLIKKKYCNHTTVP